MISPTRSPLPRRRASSPSTTHRLPGTRRTPRAARVRRLRRRPFLRRLVLRRLVLRRLRRSRPLPRRLPLGPMLLRRMPPRRAPLRRVLPLRGRRPIRGTPLRLRRVFPPCPPSPLRRLRRCRWGRLRRAYRASCPSCPWGVGFSLRLRMLRMLRLPTPSRVLRAPWMTLLWMTSLWMTLLWRRQERGALRPLLRLPSPLRPCRPFLPVMPPPTGAGPSPGLRPPCM